MLHSFITERYNNYSYSDGIRTISSNLIDEGTIVFMVQVIIKIDGLFIYNSPFMSYSSYYIQAT